MNTGERLDKSWRERGLAAYSTAAILGTLRHYGVDIDEERLKLVSSRAAALALCSQWMSRWKGTGPFAQLPHPAAMELWQRLGTQEEASTDSSQELGDTTDWEDVDGVEPLDVRWQRFEQASVDEKVALAREAADAPEFDGDDAFEMGSRLQEALRHAGRLSEFEAILADWEARAPAAYSSEEYLLAWRVDCALLRPGGEVLAPLLRLAEHRSGHLELLLSRVEWCLYRGLLQEAWAALSVAWPRVRDDTDLPPWAVTRFRSRCVLTTLDLALLEMPAPSEEQLRERLQPFEPMSFGWFERAMAWRMARRSVPAVPEGLGGDSAGGIAIAQLSLLMAFERELWERQGWPLGRTQLLHTPLLNLLPLPPPHSRKKRKKWSIPHAHRPAGFLLPEREVLRDWADHDSDYRLFHPHAEAAAALALLPWGDFLRRRGLVDDTELAAWRAAVPKVLARLPRQFEHHDDPALRDELLGALLRETGPSDS